MDNRRNYYRILHVQPEAPLEIIKASYRSLMTKLKAHPDLGGDHAAAVLINQAYAVLSDPERRRRYDVQLQARGLTPMATASTTGPAGGARSSARTSAYEAARSAARAADACAFCGHGNRATVSAVSRCAVCGTPLTARLSDTQPRAELFGRRTAPRVVRAGELLFYPHWPHPGHHGRLRDVSLCGVSFNCGHPVRGGQLLKIESSIVNGLARVASVRMAQGRSTVHAALLTAEFAIARGGFVHERA